MLAPVAQAGNSILARTAAWWREWSRRRSAADELETCGADVEFIARDVGLSPTELRVIAAKRPDATNLLHERLAVLGVDLDRLSRSSPEVLRDLERVCTVCDSKRRCVHDLTNAPEHPRWRDYCHNVPTLDALRETVAEDDGEDRVTGHDASLSALCHCVPGQY
jgi:hypothetical protein